ncbi:hypothetical protein SAY87_016650 [Trapa incisa]|uniref:3-ketoacyl-CoA synthase n=1 Tax=Trapa incisa TaxID=236973 RepID=A0AAN7QUI9_9MYRT|nr:hypothetical protein SAY87_016649 [Trapa incisa]KAK4780544.1 hypothetical protein SAY87_016650 [Trapa incisa]
MDILMSLFSVTVLFLIFLIWKRFEDRKNRDSYILDYQCYKPTDDRKLTTKQCGEIIKRNKNLGLLEYKFLLKAVVSSGIGEETYGPRIMFEGREEKPSVKDGILEMEAFSYDCIDKVLGRTGIQPSEIDVLVVNVSMLASIPSLTSYIINRYKLREDIKSFNLTGMGCSASLISVDVARNILKTYKNVNVLVLTSECLSTNWYNGKDKSMILANCLFRSGGCAILMTNKRSLRDRAMFKLKCLQRIHHACYDDSYGCCIEKEDEEGRPGFYLSRSLPKVATRAFVDNLKLITPKILPAWELVRYAILTLAHNMRHGSGKAAEEEKPMINFRTGVDHFCIHTGGKAVIDGIGNSLRLNEYELEPARMTLHRFGNTSASSLWYVLSYLEAKKRLKKGHKVLMFSFGAGFQCHSCLWEVMRDLHAIGNVWEECIDRYPHKNQLSPFMQKFAWINEQDDPDNFVIMEEP